MYLTTIIFTNNFFIEDKILLSLDLRLDCVNSPLSSVGLFLMKLCARMSDKNIDNLFFLRSYYMVTKKNNLL